MFAGCRIDVRRIALNLESSLEPAPNFAKETDSRYDGYVRQFGTDCWELDALDPTVIEDLIRVEIEKLIDPEKWRAAKEQEAARRAF